MLLIFQFTFCFMILEDLNMENQLKSMTLSTELTAPLALLAQLTKMEQGNNCIILLYHSKVFPSLQTHVS